MQYEQVLEKNIGQGFDPLQNPHTGEVRILAAVALATGTIAITGCGSSGSAEKPVSTTEIVPQTTPETTPAPVVETAPAEAVEFPAPRSFENGQFVGAITLKFANPKKGNEPIEAYYRSRGLQMPKQKNSITHRLVASTLVQESDGRARDSVEGKQLSEGGVIRKASENSDVLVIAFHDVTPVIAPVAINNRVYSDTQMGVNAVPQKGDQLVLTIPGEQKNEIKKFTYTALSKEVVALSSRPHAGATFSPIKGSKIVRTYTCWEPGDDAKRLVVTWKQTSARELRGSVVPVGKASGPDVELR